MGRPVTKQGNVSAGSRQSWEHWWGVIDKGAILPHHQPAIEQGASLHDVTSLHATSKAEKMQLQNEWGKDGSLNK